ncbi:TerC family protein [Brevibacillus ginsengisoli]|uniref:TerC family protein n=1 Tax=Brevibacillus ginsengisoli TaxID=363854 RepID=UPI003CFB6AF7
MFGMEFTEFISSLLLIIAIDIVLGGDNALVIAMASRKLPAEQKKKAIFYGTALAILIRIVATVAAAMLLQVKYLFLVGGLILVWISYKLLADENESHDIQAGNNLMQAIKTIVLADVMMGLDNVLAIAGAAHGELLIIIIGLLISVPIMIWGSNLILKAMERYAWLIYAGSAVLAWTAAKMITHEKAIEHLFVSPWVLYGFKLFVVALVIGAGLWSRTRMNKASQLHKKHEIELEEKNQATGS